MPLKSAATIEERTVGALFAGKDPAVRRIYDALFTAARSVGDVVADPKKTSIHLNAGAGGTAFAGIQPRKSGILLTLRSAVPLPSARIRRVEQASRNRFHSELLLSAPEEVDAELLGWLADGYRLAHR
jgi:hypothetical protein